MRLLALDTSTEAWVVMEVPCCAALPVIVKKGMERSGVTVPMEEVVISVRGKILERRRVQAA